MLNTLKLTDAAIQTVFNCSSWFDVAARVFGVILLCWTAARFHYWVYATKPRIYCQPTPINAKILQHCLTLKKFYYPTWYLPNGDFQTIWLSLIQDSEHPKIEYEREILNLSDGGILSLDWAYPAGKQTKENLPILLLLHGLTGSSRERYIRKMVKKANQEGWLVVVMNARGCANTPVVTQKTYCAAFTSDVRETVINLRKRFKTVPIVAVGYSLGSNILVKYLGEEGENSLLTAAASIGNPFDLMETSRNLTRNFCRKWIYNFGCACNLVKLCKQFNVREVFADHKEVDVDAVIAAKTVEEFDEHFTRKIFGFETLHTYYRQGSCAPYILRVKVPLLCINALDDPISVATSIPFDECRSNPHSILVTTKFGGHLGFFHGASAECWSSEVVAEYLKAIRRIVGENVLKIKGQDASDVEVKPLTMVSKATTTYKKQLPAGLHLLKSIEDSNKLMVCITLLITFVAAKKALPYDRISKWMAFTRRIR